MIRRDQKGTDHMKFKRQFFTLAAAVLAFLCSLSAGIVKAAAAPALSASSDQASAVSQSDVNISVSLTGNPGISTLKMSLTYDSSILQYGGSTWSSSFTENDVKMASDTGSAVNLSVVSSSDYSADGGIVTVHFKAVRNADPVPVTLVLQEMTGTDMENVTGCQVEGRIRIPAAGNTGGNSAESDTAGNTGGSTAESDAAGNTGRDTAEPDENAADRPGENVAGVSMADEEANGTDEEVSRADEASGTDKGESVADDKPGEPDSAIEESDDGNTGLLSDREEKSAGIASDEAENEEPDVSVYRSESTQTSQASAARQSVSSSTGSSKTDTSYETGAGIGKDILLILAAGCGILALVILCKREM